MSAAFLVQVGGTDPKAWRQVRGINPRLVAAQAAADAGVGYHEVFVATDSVKNKHPNGAPRCVTMFGCRVEKRDNVGTVSATNA